MTEPLTLHQRKDIESESPVGKELETYLKVSKNWGVVASFTKQRHNPNPDESKPIDETEFTEELASEALESSVKQVWGL